MFTNKKQFLVTGAAGFIGSEIVKKLLKHGEDIGIDSLNNYYDPSLKKSRLRKLKNIIITFLEIGFSMKTR